MIKDLWKRLAEKGWKKFLPNLAAISFYVLLTAAAVGWIVIMFYLAAISPASPADSSS